MDATNLYGHSMSQPLPHDGFKMWHGRPDLYINKLEEILITPDGSDSDNGFFVDVDLKDPDKIRRQNKEFSTLS